MNCMKRRRFLFLDSRCQKTVTIPRSATTSRHSGSMIRYVFDKVQTA